MSVVVRNMDGRLYIQVRRKVNGEQKQRFYHIDNISSCKLNLYLAEAKDIDEEWKAEQTKTGVMSLFFYSSGKPRYIRVVEPKREGEEISVLAQINTEKDGSFCASRSTEKHGFLESFNHAFSALIEHFGFNKNSPTIIIVKRLIKDKLAEDYKRLRKGYTIC